jgi:hypothetical protein
MFIFYSIHYPHPDKEVLLVQSMHEYGMLMQQQPGNIFQAPYPFKDPEKGTLIGISIWESEEAFQAALPILRSARQKSPATPSDGTDGSCRCRRRCAGGDPAPDAGVADPGCHVRSYVPCHAGLLLPGWHIHADA